MLIRAALLTRSLGLSNYGVWALVVTYVSTVSQLLDSRVFEAMIRFIPQFRSSGDYRRAAGVVQLCLGIEIVAALSSSCVAWVTAEWATSMFIRDYQATTAIRLYALTTIANAFAEPMSVLLRLANQFRALAGEKVLRAFLQTAGVGVCTLVSPTVEAMLAVQLIGAAFGSLVLCVLGRRAASVLVLPVFEISCLSSLRGYVRSILSMILQSNIIASSRIITARSDVLLLGIFGTPASAGTYEIAKRLVEQFNSLSTSMYNAIFPEVSKLAAKRQHGQLRSLIRISTLRLLAMTVPLCALGTTVLPFLIPWIFGGQFKVAVVPAQILIWYLPWISLLWVPAYLISIGKIKQLTVLTCVDSIIFLLLLLLACNLFEELPTVVAIATVARYYVWMSLGGILVSTNILSGENETVSRAAKGTPNDHPRTL